MSQNNTSERIQARGSKEYSYRINVQVASLLNSRPFQPDVRLFVY